MKVLVTGGNGFIGRHIVKELVSRNIEVISFDIIQPPQVLKGVKYVTSTVLDTFTMCKYLRGCDAVFHLAAILGVRRADQELLGCMTINIQGTINVLEACVMSGVPYILLASSSEIFGDINTKKIQEDSVFSPKSGYAISKLAAEKYVEGFGKEYGINYNIGRFFNIYGPGQVAEFVVPRFIKMVQNDLVPKIYGDGKQIRSYCHISDAARAVSDIFLNNNIRNEILNIGNDLEPITVTDLSSKIINLMGADLKPEFVDFSDSDRNTSREIYYRVPDITKIRRLLNYEPRIMIDQGIQSVIDGGDIPESWTEIIVEEGK
jgi:UDP-glucose 4-epimerase